MEEALRALNRLVADGVIGGYAIGGAVGAAFYIKAAQTEDLDAFVFLPASASGLISLSPIYEALNALGGVIEREYVRFGNWPVQILPDANPLVGEAISHAIKVDYDGTPTRVFRSEHLCAVALQTGRSKDMLRVRMFLEQGAVELDTLKEVVSRFGLAERLAKVLE
jgi:hypothetical protein